MATNSSHRAHLVNLLAPAWRRGVDDARALPRTSWWRWIATLLIGYLASWVVVVITVQTARGLMDQGLQQWDQRWLSALADSWFSYPAGLWFEAWASSAFLVPMLLVALVLLTRCGYFIRALTLLVAYLSTKGLVLGAWQLWDRPRPEMIAEGIASPGLHSFPSGHAVNAVVMFGLLGSYWWRSSRSPLERVLSVVCLVMVIGVTSIGRVRIGTHWPSDMLGGFVIGLIWMSALALAVKLAEDR